VFGRPALLTSRAHLPREVLGQILEDRRGARIVPRLERGLWVFRPEEPFDLRGSRNPRIRVAHLVVDLVASPGPADEWLGAVRPRAFRFNYDRSLA
jgi:hypothetical protein